MRMPSDGHGLLNLSNKWICHRLRMRVSSLMAIFAIRRLATMHVHVCLTKGDCASRTTNLLSREYCYQTNAMLKSQCNYLNTLSHLLWFTVPSLKPDSRDIRYFDALALMATNNLACDGNPFTAKHNADAKTYELITRLADPFSAKLATVGEAYNIVNHSQCSLQRIQRWSLTTPISS